MPLTDSLYGKQGIEQAQDPDFNAVPEMDETNPALGDDTTPPNSITPQESNMDGTDNTATPIIQEVSADAVEQHINFTSTTEASAEGTTTFQAVAEHLVVSSNMSTFSEPLEIDTTTVSSMATSPQPTAHELGNSDMDSMPPFIALESPRLRSARSTAQVRFVLKVIP